MVVKASQKEVGGAEKKNVVDRKSEKEKNQKKMGRVMERIQGMEEVAG